MGKDPLLGHVADVWTTTCQRFSAFTGHHLGSMIDHDTTSRSPRRIDVEDVVSKNTRRNEGGGSSKEQVGRATWTFLHTLAAQYPEHPTYRQKRDARNLIDIMTRMYPCGECAEHFSEVVKACPPRVNSRHEFSQWMCRVHNIVNRSIGKPEFNCSYVSSRWEAIDCDTPRGCSLR